MASQIDKCLQCGARIIWVFATATGRRMPMDAATDPKGTWIIETCGPDYYARCVGKDFTKYAGIRHKSHFATCPDANRFRVKRK